MEKELIKKVSRFLELSNKFSKSVSDVFPKSTGDVVYYTGVSTGYCGSNGFIGGSDSSNGVTITGSLVLNQKKVYVGDDGILHAKDNTPITRADNIRAKAELSAILSDEFDEYCVLQYELGNFLSALNKINK